MLRVMPNTATMTPTTPAMPITMTLELPRRRGILRRFIAVTAPIWFRTLMLRSFRVESRFEVPGSLATGQSVDDADALRAPGGRQRAYEGDDGGNAETGADH